ncbi:protein required for normal CLN1 and CLN2 G1 cyclin expression [Sparganum proliferum]
MSAGTSAASSVYEGSRSDISDYPSANAIEIPLRGGDEVIELDIDQLPEGEEVINILTQETAPLPVWINVALAYYKKKLFDDFEKVLEEARKNVANLQTNNENDLVQLFDMLANYCGRKASKEKNKEKRNQLIERATALFTSADRIAMYDQKHLLGRAFYFIYEGENWSQADSQLNFVLNQGSPSVPAYLGKACIAFNKQEYRNALGFYRKALRLQPNCPASVRLGIGHCFARLGNLEKARMAFQRALDLDPDSVKALVGLAILDLNEKTQESIKQGVQRLSRAYNLDPTNSMVLNHLADHFFYKKEYAKVHCLASHAFYETENEAIRAESSYQMARAFHMEGDYDKAFQYYYLATQFASPTFLLPFYGLGQMYLHRNDLEHAAIAFEKVLKAYPNNYETLKILGSLYAQSNKLDKRAQAKQLFKQVTESQPDDVEAWIEYATLLENDIPGALNAYLNALNILENIQLEVSPEILNNIGVLYFMKGEYEKSSAFFTRAYDRICEEQKQEAVAAGNGDALPAAAQPPNPAPLMGLLAMQATTELHRRTASGRPVGGGSEDYYQDISVTVRYNQARLQEAMNRPDLAEAVYKSILLQHPTYVDCYLRLGCIARDRGQLRDASVWFKEVLDINPDNPDAWTLFGLLHLSKNEVDQAQKKFERIIRQPEFRADAFCRITLGNIWLRTLHHPVRDKDRRKRHQERALSCYKGVLSADPRNTWAAHGIGCVLAHKGFVNEARDVFAQVREATADFPDVWINIAHIYVEQKQFTAAIQMYENCIRKFSRQNDTELLQYLARAFFKANQLKECKAVLLKARHVKPWDPLLTFNLALVQKRMAVIVLSDETSSFSAVCEAIADLNMARCTFDHLSKVNEVVNQSMAADEAKACQDLLSQAKYHLDRAKSREEQERVFRQRQEEEREAKRQREAEVQAKVEALRLEREKRLEEERGKFLEKAKQIIIDPVAVEKKGRKSGAGGKRRTDEFVQSGDDSVDSSGSETHQRSTDTTRKKKSRRSEGGHSRSRRSEGRSSKSSKSHRASREDRLSAKQRGRVVSKAIISDEDDSGSSDEEESAHQQRMLEFRKAQSAATATATAAREFDSSEDDAGVTPESSDDDRQAARGGGSRRRRANAPSESSSEEEEAASVARRHAHKRKLQKRRNFSDQEEEEEESGKEKEHTAQRRRTSPEVENDDNEDEDSDTQGTNKRARLLASSDDEEESDGSRRQHLARAMEEEEEEDDDEQEQVQQTRLRLPQSSSDSDVGF